MSPGKELHVVWVAGVRLDHDHGGVGDLLAGEAVDVEEQISVHTPSQIPCMYVVKGSAK